jgi:hypothetical protein
VHSAEDWEELLLPEIERQQKLGKEVVFRADAAFAKPELYDALEERGGKYAIRIPSNDRLERDIAELLTGPVGRPSYKPVVWDKSFLYQAASWKTARRVVAKVEFPRVGFIMTNLETDSRAVVRFYNKRGTAEQWIKEGKKVVKTQWTCRARPHRGRGPADGLPHDGRRHRGTAGPSQDSESRLGRSFVRRRQCNPRGDPASGKGAVKKLNKEILRAPAQKESPEAGRPAAKRLRGKGRSIPQSWYNRIIDRNGWPKSLPGAMRSRTTCLSSLISGNRPFSARDQTVSSPIRISKTLPVAGTSASSPISVENVVKSS